MRVVISNVPPEKADEIARALVEERLAACVNALPVRSFYRWEDKLCVDEEQTLLIKVAAERVRDLEIRLRELHPYDVPEIVALPVDEVGSLKAYVDWVRDETRPPEMA